MSRDITITEISHSSAPNSRTICNHGHICSVSKINIHRPTKTQ